MCHVTYREWQTLSQNARYLALTVCDLRYFEVLEEKDNPGTESLNLLIDDKGVCQTTPATLDL